MMNRDQRERRMRMLNGIIVTALVVLMLLAIFGAFHPGPHRP